MLQKSHALTLPEKRNLWWHWSQRFILDNAARDGESGGINAIDEILAVLPNLELVNGYLKIQDLDSKAESECLAMLAKHLNTLRPLVMENVPARGLSPDQEGFANCSHKVGLVYASAVPVDSYLNQGGKADFQTKVAELILLGQYYGALKYAAESEKEKGQGKRRKVFLMPLGGGVFNNPWDIIGKSMARAVEMLDDDLLAMLDVSALVWNRKPSEEQSFKAIFDKLTQSASASYPGWAFMVGIQVCKYGQVWPIQTIHSFRGNWQSLETSSNVACKK